MGNKKTESSSDKEARTLKKENQNLRKQLNRLRKKISRLVSVHGLDIQIEDEEHMEITEENPETPDESNCPQCDSGKLREVKAGWKVFLICDNKRCLYRKKIAG